MTCILCQQEKPIYQMKNPCCRARFLVNQPSKQHRQDWLARWERELDADTLNEIRTLTIKLWETKTLLRDREASR